MKNKKILYVLPIVIIAMVVGFILTTPVNSVTMDVNPSIEIVTNRLDRVMEINALNKDAEKVLDGFESKNKNLENTVNDLVDLMILTGHIKGGEDNFVMLTVEDGSVDSKLVDKVNKAIMAILENKKIEATILNQAIAKNANEEKQTGVQLAAQKLKETNDNLTVEEIGDMTVRELIQYSRENNIQLENIFRVTAESKNMISGKEAQEIALKIVEGEVLKVELDDLYDDPEYEIKILADNKKHEIEIDAYTGEVTKYKIEDMDDDEKQTTGSKISFETAKAIAIEKVGGGTITKFELDDDEYEVKIKNNGREYEIEIDAYTGEVTKYKVEDSDDDDD